MRASRAAVRGEAEGVEQQRHVVVLGARLHHEVDGDERVERLDALRGEVRRHLEVQPVRALGGDDVEQRLHAPVVVGDAARELGRRAARDLLEANGDALRGPAARGVEDVRRDAHGCSPVQRRVTRPARRAATSRAAGGGISPPAMSIR